MWNLVVEIHWSAQIKAKRTRSISNMQCIDWAIIDRKSRISFRDAAESFRFYIVQFCLGFGLSICVQTRNWKKKEKTNGATNKLKCNRVKIIRNDERVCTSVSSCTHQNEFDHRWHRTSERKRKTNSTKWEQLEQTAVQTNNVNGWRWSRNQWTSWWAINNQLKLSFFRHFFLFFRISFCFLIVCASIGCCLTFPYMKIVNWF